MQGKTKKDLDNILSFLASPSHPQPISLLIISLTYGKGEGEALYQIVQNKYQNAVKKKKNKGKKKPPSLLTNLCSTISHRCLKGIAAPS